jgi:anti-sigma-K factor RskA
VSEDGPGSGADDRDLTPAEYVIGLLTPAEAREVEARAIEDPALARSILAWQRRLSGMTRWVRPVAPPASVWQRLEAEIVAQPAPQTEPSRNAGLGRQGWLAQAWVSLAFWRGLAATSFFAGAMLVVAIVGPKLWTSQPAVAALIPLDSPMPAFLVMVTKDGYATVIANAAEVQPGNSLELWVRPPGAVALVSLGVIPVTGQIRMQVAMSAGTLLLVSSEPKGGSPTGAPTGPVVYRGRMVRG